MAARELGRLGNGVWKASPFGLFSVMQQRHGCGQLDYRDIESRSSPIGCARGSSRQLPMLKNTVSDPVQRVTSVLRVTPSTTSFRHTARSGRFPGSPACPPPDA